MNRPLEPVGSVNHPPIRLDTGVDVLERWAAGAGQDEKELVYAALFAMTDRMLLRSYEVVEDEDELSQFAVLLPGLVLRMRVHSFDSYGVVSIEAR
jgi:uncharacterized protein DUF6235